MCKHHPNPNFDLVSRIGTLTMTLVEMLVFLLVLALVCTCSCVSSAPSDRSVFMRQRLQPIVKRRGYAVGAAPLRIGNLVYAILFALALGGFAVGTIAMADVVRSATMSS